MMGQQDRAFIILTTTIRVITLNQGPGLGQIPGAPVLLLGLGEGDTGQPACQEPTRSHHSGSHAGVTWWSHMCYCVTSLSVQQVLSVMTIIVSTDRQTIELYCRKWEKSGKNTQQYSVRFRVVSVPSQPWSSSNYNDHQLKYRSGGQT